MDPGDRERLLAHAEQMEQMALQTLDLALEYAAKAMQYRRRAGVC